MSSPKPAARPLAKGGSKPPRRAKTGQGTVPAKARARVAIAAEDAGLSAQAQHLAAALERALAAGDPGSLSPEALQALMAALCRTYAAQIEHGAETLPLTPRGTVTSTDIMLMASALLRSANLAVFELGMWQSWTGR